MVRLKLFAFLILALIAGCDGPTKPGTPSPKPTPTPAPTPAPTNITQVLLTAHNAERAKIGAPPLVLNAKLSTAAQKHANWMAANNKMSHTGAGGSSFADRIRDEGYTFATGGENIAAGYPTADAVVNGWMNSPGHRANILNPNYKEVGFGVNGRFWCTVFASPLSRSAIVQPDTSLPGGLEWKGN